jgi:hypothetical protein
MPTSDPASGPVPPRRRGGAATGRTLLGAVLGLAMLGAATLMLAEDIRWLRLGIVAALWAALVGSFAAARYRREVAADRELGEELRAVYQLELEREVAARREYELEMDAGIRRRVEQEVRHEVRDELESLRTELSTLRRNLEQALGGQVPVERMALRAESTRLRSLPDQPPARALPPTAAQRPVQARSPVEPATPASFLPRYRASAGPPGAQIAQVRAPQHGPPGNVPATNGNNGNGNGYTGRRRRSGEDDVTHSVDDLLAKYAGNGVYGPPRSRHRRDGG